MSKRIAYELFRGLAYRGIRHKEMRLYTTWMPLGLAAILISGYLLLPQKPELLGKDGAISAGLSVLSTLPGFFFAGLAAVATFGGASMDQEMPAPAPEVRILMAGAPAWVKLTRRQFLSYLFSYLVIVSFLLCFSMILLNLTAPTLQQLNVNLSSYVHGQEIWFAGKLGAVAVLVAIFSSMAISTLHGVFFLTEKIHQP